MEQIGFQTIIGIVSNFGVPGILFVLWWFTTRAHERTLQSYKDDMREMRVMYENNVNLVKGYQGLAGDLKDVVIMNTQAMTTICEDVRNNQFCPMVRLRKQASGVEGHD